MRFGIWTRLIALIIVAGLWACPDGLAQDVFHIPVMSGKVVRLCWEPSTDEPGGSGLRGYKIYQIVDGVPHLLSMAAAEDDSATVVAMVNDYYEKSIFYVTAFDWAGNESGPSNTAGTICHNGPAVLLGDLNQDGVVDIEDYFTVKWLEGWWCTDELPGYREDADLMPDCKIDIEDRFVVRKNMGEAYRESN